MIGDCLLPVYTSVGPSTLISSFGRLVYGEGCRFVTLEGYKIQQENAEFYNIHIEDTSDYDKKKVSRLLLCPDAELLTKNGWLSVRFISEYVKENNLLDIYVRGLQTSCIVCGEWFFCNKPIWSTCSITCQKLTIKNRIYNYILVDQTNIQKAKRENWVKIISAVKTRNIYSGYDVVEVKNNIYIRDVLVKGKQNGDEKDVASD